MSGKDEYSKYPQHFATGVIRGIKQKLKCIWWFNRYCFGYRGAKVPIPMTTMIMLFAVGRQKELAHFSRVYVTYAGIMHLQNDLICRETLLYRQMLQTFPGLENVELVSCSMEGYVEGLKKYGRRYPERIQFSQFLLEHPEVVGIEGISQ